MRRKDVGQKSLQLITANSDGSWMGVGGCIEPRFKQENVSGINYYARSFNCFSNGR